MAETGGQSRSLLLGLVYMRTYWSGKNKNGSMNMVSKVVSNAGFGYLKLKFPRLKSNMKMIWQKIEDSQSLSIDFFKE